LPNRPQLSVGEWICSLNWAAFPTFRLVLKRQKEFFAQGDVYIMKSDRQSKVYKTGDTVLGNAAGHDPVKM